MYQRCLLVKLMRKQANLLKTDELIDIMITIMFYEKQFQYYVKEKSPLLPVHVCGGIMPGEVDKNSDVVASCDLLATPI